MILESWLNGLSINSPSGRRTLRLLRGASDVVVATAAGLTDEETYSARHLGFHIAEVPLFLSGTPAYDLTQLNAKLVSLLGNPAVDDICAPYASLYDAMVTVLREGGPKRLFDTTWHPQRIENVPFILHSPGLERRLDEVTSHVAEAGWVARVRAEIAVIAQDNPHIAPATLLDNPLYVWGGAAMDGFFTDKETLEVGRFLSGLVAAAPDRYDKARLMFQAVAIGHLTAQYVPEAPVARFVELCASAGFHFEISAKHKRVVDYVDSTARALHDALTTPIEAPFPARIESGSIYLADRGAAIDAAAEDSGRASYLRYLSTHGLAEAQVLPIAPKLSPDREAKIAAILLVALQQDHVDLVHRVQEARQQNTNALVALLHRGLVRRLVQGDIAVPDKTFAAVFPTNSYNAHVAAQPDLYLILINTGLFELLGMLAGFFFVDAFGSRAERVRLAAQHINAYCEHRVFPEPDDLARATPRAEFFAWQIHLVSAAEEFALAHELGHVACGHAGGSVTRLALASGRPIAVAAKSPAQEEDADRWALAALTRTFGMRELDRELACSGILFFLATAAVVEAAMAARGIIDDTHPPAMNRYFAARYALAKAGLDRYTTLGERYRDFTLQIARELSLDLPERAGTAAVVKHVALMVQDELQAPVAIEFPSGLQAALGAQETHETNWWRKLWRRKKSD